MTPTYFTEALARRVQVAVMHVHCSPDRSNDVGVTTTTFSLRNCVPHWFGVECRNSFVMVMRMFIGFVYDQLPSHGYHGSMSNCRARLPGASTSVMTFVCFVTFVTPMSHNWSKNSLLPHPWLLYLEIRPDNLPVRVFVVATQFFRHILATESQLLVGAINCQRWDVH